MKTFLSTVARLIARLRGTTPAPTHTALLETAIASALATDVVGRVAELDAYRHQLAGDDPMLSAMLGDIELAYVCRLGRDFHFGQRES